MMHHSAEHGPILLAWMLLNYRGIDLYEEDERYLKYRKFGAKAVHLGVFGYLRTVICHPMFKASLCRLRKAAAAAAYKYIKLYDTI